MVDLFSAARPAIEEVYPSVFLMAGFADSQLLLSRIKQIIKSAPFRKMQTPAGHYTNVEMTSCGDFGWISDATGYRYSPRDPLSGAPWPNMPRAFSSLAQSAAETCGFPRFHSNACLINHYRVGDKLGSHQDKDEGDFNSPIVSISIGLPAIFQIFGNKRSGIEKQLTLYDGDVMVWGKESRLIYHGVRPIKAAPNQPALTDRYNITFRYASPKTQRKHQLKQ